MPTFRARWVFPVASPPILNGSVSTRLGRVFSVNSAETVPVDDDLGAVAVLPGFVNAHTHLDLTGAANHCPPNPSVPFPQWLEQVISFRRSRSEPEVEQDILDGINELAACGTVLVGDVSASGSSAALLAADGRVGGVVFREFIGIRANHHVSVPGALDSASTSQFNTIVQGVSPHAPYSVGCALLNEIAYAAVQRQLSVMVHIAESREEVELIQSRSGPFVSFLQSLNVYHPDELVTCFRQFLDVFCFAPRLLLVHANFLPVVDVPSNATVVYCPRTHAAFGHPLHPVLEFLSAGVPVCLGTDSRASNPDLDVFAEARFLTQIRPNIPGAALVTMLTVAGATALGFGATHGTLEPGKVADFVAVPVDPTEPDPYRALFGPVRGPVRRIPCCGSP